MVGLGIGIPFSRVLGSIGTTIAQNHHARVIADGGVMPVTAAEIASLLNPICAAYNITTTAQFNTQFPTFKDEHWTGYRPGAGAGVTLGQAVQTVYSINPAADAVQTTAASQPLLLNWIGENYWFSAGVAGNFVSTPNAVANQITGDIEINLYANWVVGSLGELVSKWRTGTQAYLLFLNANGTFDFYWSTTGTNSFNVVSSVGITSGLRHVKITRSASTGNIVFLTSTDGISYTQLGVTRTSTPSGIFAGTSRLDLYGQTAVGFNGRARRATISNTIGGAPVVDFNPQLYNAATSQTQWTAATGEVWTINKSTGNTFTGKLVDRTYAMGNGTTTSMSVGLAATQTYTEYVSFARNGAGNLVARATGNTRQHTGTNITLNNGTLLNLANTSSISQIATYLSKGASSSIAANNGTPTAGNAGANNGTDLTILQGAHVFNGLVQSSTEDTTAQRLQMFNSLKLMARF